MNDEKENKLQRADDTLNETGNGSKMMNLPNKLTLSRIIMIPFFVLFFYLHFTGHIFIAFAIFAVASVTDFLDGAIARKYNLVTNFGKFLDPIADKVLVFAAYIVFLTEPEIFTAGLGDWALIAAGCCVAVVLARETIVSGFRMVAASSGVVIAADIVGKYKTFSQDIAVAMLLIGAGVAELTDGIAGDIINYIGLVFFALSTLLAVISGINYIAKNFEVLKK